MIATGLLTIGLGLGAVNTPANASSWHKGTPRVTRGHWTNGNAKWYVTKKGYNLGVVGGTGYNMFWGKPYYKYVGHHVYRVKCFDFPLNRTRTMHVKYYSSHKVSFGGTVMHRY